MKFQGTKRNMYEKSDVKSLRLTRKQSKPKREGVSAQIHQFMLGDLMAAGHLKLHGLTKTSRIETQGEVLTQIENEIKFISVKYPDLNGERPHLTGYLVSASDADKHPYHIKGWINPDGTIRIELVNNKTL